MAAGDPVEVAVPVVTWTKVATSVTAGQISIINPMTEKWYWTQNATGTGVPINEDHRVRFDPQNLIIDSSVAIDVYLYLTGSTAGLVRVI